jgi:hypothetical protein
MACAMVDSNSIHLTHLYLFQCIAASSLRALHMLRCCRDEFVGYSLCTLPNSPGCHHVSCPVWAAVEARRGFRQELTSEQAAAAAV